MVNLYQEMPLWLIFYRRACMALAGRSPPVARADGNSKKKGERHQRQTVTRALPRAALSVARSRCSVQLHPLLALHRAAPFVWHLISSLEY